MSKILFLAAGLLSLPVAIVHALLFSDSPAAATRSIVMGIVFSVVLIDLGE